jgi:hypothetical protein
MTTATATRPTSIDDEIAAYDSMKADIEAKYFGKWIIIFEGKVIGAYDSFDKAATDAAKKYGRGPYLIRQVGGQPTALPASVAYARHGR